MQKLEIRKRVRSEKAFVLIEAKQGQLYLSRWSGNTVLKAVRERTTLRESNALAELVEMGYAGEILSFADEHNFVVMRER